MLPFPINISAALKSPRSLLRHVLSIHSIASGSVTSVKEINKIIVVSSPPCTVKEVELRFRVEPFHKQSSYYFFRICMEFQDDIRGTKVRDYIPSLVPFAGVIRLSSSFISKAGQE